MTRRIVIFPGNIRCISIAVLLSIDRSSCKAIVFIPARITEDIVIIKNPFKPNLIYTHWIEERSRETQFNKSLRADNYTAISNFEITQIFIPSVIIRCVNCNLLISINQNQVNILVIVPNLSIRDVPIIKCTLQYLFDCWTL